MKMSSRTRVATEKDIPACMELLREFFNASPYREDFTFEEDRVHNLVKVCLSNIKRFVVIVSVDETDTPVGIIAGRLEEAPFSSDISAFEMVWFIRPEHRNGRRAIELMDVFEGWAAAIKARFVYYSVLRSPDTPALDPVERLYVKRGFKPVEAGYMKRIS